MNDNLPLTLVLIKVKKSTSIKKIDIDFIEISLIEKLY